MRVQSVSYEELRTFGNYQNERIGITLALHEDASPEATLDDAIIWVRARLDERSRERNQAITERQSFNNLQRQQRDLEDDIRDLTARKAALVALITEYRAWLGEHNLQLPADWPDSLPF